MSRSSLADPEKFELASIVTKNSRSTPLPTQPASRATAASWSPATATSTTTPTSPKPSQVPISNPGDNIKVL
jgi:hypothetical protein